MERITFEEQVSNSLKNKYRLRMDIANFAKDFIPKYILLDKTRNIHSYMLYCEIRNGVLTSPYWNKDNMKDRIMSFLRTQYSSLDRPLFFILQNDEEQILIIESTTIREELLKNPLIDINKFIINESVELLELLPRIYDEL